MDTIGDFLTVIRNASLAKKDSCEVQASKVKQGIANILKRKGFIDNFEEKVDEKGFNKLFIKLKYVNGEPVITKIERISKLGCRRYVKSASIPRILGGLGYCLLSTSKGVVSGEEARRLNVGGELLCKIW